MTDEDGSKIKCCECDRESIGRFGGKFTPSGSVEGWKPYCEKHVPAKWKKQLIVVEIPRLGE